MATATWHKHHCQTAQPADLNICIRLLKPMYLSLTAFHFHIFTHKLLRSTLFKLGIPFLSALGHHVTPIPMLNPLVPTQCLQHSLWADSGVQNIMTQLPYDHANNSFFTQLYLNRNNQLSADSHCPVPWEPTCNKFSEWCFPTFKSCNICVLKTVFFL
jgi:hypothetical protein